MGCAIGGILGEVNSGTAEGNFSKEGSAGNGCCLRKSEFSVSCMSSFCSVTFSCSGTAAVFSVVFSGGFSVAGGCSLELSSVVFSITNIGSDSREVVSSFFSSSLTFCFSGSTF